jgi:dTDP-4-dehydrorhamnose 3,5-epimerase
VIRLGGLRIFERAVHTDARGSFREVWRASDADGDGPDATFVQDNVSVSRRGVLRGLHFQHPASQGKLVAVIDGRIFDVAVDIRRGSPTFGAWDGVELSASNGRQLWIPPGFAHGFQILSESASVLYKCTAYYEPPAEQTLHWDDAEVGIDWPLADPILSAKDAAAPLLRELRPRLPEYAP